MITERINENKVILRCLSNNSNEILQIVSELEYMTELDWCEPEMLFDYKICNPLYSQQYYLRNTGQNGGTQGIDINVEPAWNITNGNPDITVAVIDEGVDRNHEDFGSRVLEGYTIRNENGFGAPQNAGTMPETCKGHGVACAGTIAAANNAIGIRGVAPNIQILPINIVPDPVILDAWGRVLISGFGSNIEIAQAINWAWKRADILSCSWGGAGISNDITLAIDSARTYGRNGKGAVVVFASGNNNPVAANVAFPANVDGVITVGAVNNQGTIWNYSQRGVSMDLVAPSGNINLSGDVRTTDRMGNLGYNNGNYMNNFGGTSAACPQVAGVAALMLSVRPDLTETQVRATLQNTARDLGTSGFDNTYGYGLVNAYAAVNAVAPTISGPSTLCDQATYTINNLPPGAVVEWSTDYHCSILSGQGTDSVTIRREFTGYSNSGRITARIQIGDRHFEIEKTGISMGTKQPAIAVFDSSGQYIVSPPYYTGTSYYITAYGEGLAYKPINYFNWEITPPPGDQYYLPEFNNGYRFVFNPGAVGVYNIKLKYYNPQECGWSNQTSTDLEIHKGNGAILLFTPNPASEYVTISLADGVSKNDVVRGAFTASYSLTIQLWNSFGMVKSVNTDQPEYQLDLTGVPPGFYYVHVIKEGETYRRQLVVQ